MFQINNNDFQILAKYKKFLDYLDKSLENVPRKDIYYKDLIRQKAFAVLENILECSYEENMEKILGYKKRIKSNISILDFLIDRLFTIHYINEKQASKITVSLVEINKMVSGWINNMVKSAS